MSHKKFGPDRFSRFDVYYDTQTDKQTDKPNLYIDVPGKYKDFLAENTSFFYYYVRILALKLGEWDALYFLKANIKNLKKLKFNFFLNSTFYRNTGK